MDSKEVDQRIERILERNKKFGISVNQGVEAEPARSHAGAGQIDVTIPSAMSAEAELASRTASQQVVDTCGAPQFITMSDSSGDASPANSVKIAHLTLWRANRAEFWDNGGRSIDNFAKVYVSGADGERRELTGPGALFFFTELKQLGAAAKVAKGGK